MRRRRGIRGDCFFDTKGNATVDLTGPRWLCFICISWIGLSCTSTLQGASKQGSEMMGSRLLLWG